MSYIRVIPRDLFNEANLLKCYGQLYICLETAGEHRAKFGVEDVDAFDVVQRDDDGATFIANLPLLINGAEYRLTRPLNSRQPWPLYAEAADDPDADPVDVFDDAGKLSADMLALIRAA